MNTRRNLFFPPRWIKCPPVGDLLLDLFIPCKTPLDHKYSEYIQNDEDVFDLDSLFESVAPYQLGLIIDLTKSTRFYHRNEVENRGCSYVKVSCKGNEECPTEEQVNLFNGIVNQFKEKNKDNAKKIAVHCTHGFNRTGFMIVSYLVVECGYSLGLALKLFAEVRSPGVYKEDYLKELYTRYDDPDDCPPAPELPDWYNEDGEVGEPVVSRKRIHPDSPTNDDVDLPAKIQRVQLIPQVPSGQPKLMEGVKGVETLDQSSYEAHLVRTVVEYLIKLGGVLHQNSEGESSNAPPKLQQAHESLAPPISSLSEDISLNPIELELNCDPKLRFRGSQPVSITRQNAALIADNPYLVTYKSDGTRYLMLIHGPGKVYLIDRGNFVYKVGCLEFPTLRWLHRAQEDIRKGSRPSDFNTEPHSHLVNTLVDGELVAFDNTPDRPIKYLVYDAIVIYGQPIGKSPIERRLEWIEKYILFPRNDAGHKGLVDFTKQTFSVRKKPFFSINKVGELINIRREVLQHKTDGLIFQPAGPQDFYVLDTCNETLKWKPPELNTIDFLCRIRYHTAIGEVSQYIGELFLGGEARVPAARLAKVTSRDMVYDGKIVECAVDYNLGGWKVLRIRSDKTVPNHISVGKRIIDSIQYPVGSQDVLRFASMRIQYVQQRRREEEERAKRAAEIDPSSSHTFRQDN
ncbi:hypothetical protein Aperf_G00000093685 [Anoplocephala perfoliata]